MFLVNCSPSIFIPFDGFIISNIYEEEVVIMHKIIPPPFFLHHPNSFSVQRNNILLPKPLRGILVIVRIVLLKETFSLKRRANTWKDNQKKVNILCFL